MQEGIIYTVIICWYTCGIAVWGEARWFLFSWFFLPVLHFSFCNEHGSFYHEERPWRGEHPIRWDEVCDCGCWRWHREVCRTARLPVPNSSDCRAATQRQGLVTRREPGMAPSLETEVRADIQGSSWVLRKAGASEISQRLCGGWAWPDQGPLDTKFHRIGVKKSINALLSNTWKLFISKVRWCPRGGIKFLNSSFLRLCCRPKAEPPCTREGPHCLFSWLRHAPRAFTSVKFGNSLYITQTRIHSSILMLQTIVFRQFKQKWSWKDLVFSSAQPSPGLVPLSSCPSISYQSINLLTYVYSLIVF